MQCCWIGVVLLIVLVHSPGCKVRGDVALHRLQWDVTPFSCTGPSDCPVGRLKHPLLVHVSSTTIFPADLSSAVIYHDVHDAPIAFLLNETGVDLLEWSSCGGSLVDVVASAGDDKGASLLRHLQSQHMCSVSSLGVCRSTLDGKTVVDPLQPNSKRHTLACVGGWVGAELGSPFTSAAGRSARSPSIHMRPSGLVLGDDAAWCAMLLAEHDTLCGHHLSRLLTNPQDDATALLRNSLPSLQFFLSTAYHRFSIRAERTVGRYLPDGGGEGVESGGDHEGDEEVPVADLIRVRKDVSFLVMWRDELSALKAHDFYKREEIKKLFFTTPSPTPSSSPAITNAALASVPLGFVNQRVMQNDSARGTIMWEVYRSKRSSSSSSSSGVDDSSTLSSHDDVFVVDVLAMVPLKIATPIFHSAVFLPRAGCTGHVDVMRPHVDKISETVAALLRITNRCRREDTAVQMETDSDEDTNNILFGTVTVELIFSFLHQEQLPPNANKAYFLPNGLYRFRESKEGRKSAPLQLDDDALTNRLFDLFVPEDVDGDKEDRGKGGFTWLYGRVRGTCVVTLAIGDPAMVFNAVALGMLGPAMLIGGLFRVLLRGGRKTDRSEEEESSSAHHEKSD